MNDAKRIKNWTILPVVGKTPGCVEVSRLATETPRLMGDVLSHRRIHNAWVRASDNECGMTMPVDVISSTIVDVRRYLDRSRMQAQHVLTVITKSGSVYELEGPPRPQFELHCKAWCIDPKADDAFQELFWRLSAVSKPSRPQW